MHYEIEPWTRDGRVKAYVVQVAPDVSGLVTDVPVHDNQDVKAGDVLFEIDRARFQLAYDQAQASVRSQQVAREQALRDAKRNRALGQLVAAEALEQSQTKLQQTEAALAQAEVQLNSARLNLERSRVLAATDGRVTNLDLRAGAYATAGRGVMALVDSGSFYIEGYFEETKLPRIHEGDPVTVTLMGDDRRIHGHVESIALGIADRDRSTGANLLPNQPHLQLGAAGAAHPGAREDRPGARGRAPGGRPDRHRVRQPAGDRAGRRRAAPLLIPALRPPSPHVLPQPS